MANTFEERFGKFKNLFDPTYKFREEYNAKLEEKGETAKDRLLKPRKVYGNQEVPKKIVKVETMLIPGIECAKVSEKTDRLVEDDSDSFSSEKIHSTFVTEFSTK